jgi:anhydro-N-acetylmuramic acid kinase
VAWFIGLMSGTSLDGIDGVLAEIANDGVALASRAHVHHPLPPALRSELLALNSPGPDELHRAALAASALMDGYAEVVVDLLQRGGVSAPQVTAIGAHGQTVRHRPCDFGEHGYTLQLMNGARLAERSGIDVVCDFRSRDIAAGGEGAPLVPAFHAAVFARAGHSRAVLNLGGMANLSLLGRDGAVLGYDTGPGNVLMDLWCQRERGLAYDAGGAWAASGQVIPGLLSSLLAEPFFARRPPKSTGRDLFDAAWLATRLAGFNAAAADVMATLAELTVHSVCDALRRDAPGLDALVVCGGGAHNDHLLQRLSATLGSAVAVSSSAAAGLPPDQVEALAFAWLAWAHLARRPGSLPAVTGARGARVLGALYPA